MKSHKSIQNISTVTTTIDNGELHSTGELTLSGSDVVLTGDGVTQNGNVTTSGTLDITGAVTVDGTLTVSDIDSDASLRISGSEIVNEAKTIFSGTVRNLDWSTFDSLATFNSTVGFNSTTSFGSGLILGSQDIKITRTEDVFQSVLKAVPASTDTISFHADRGYLAPGSGNSWYLPLTLPQTCTINSVSVRLTKGSTAQDTVYLKKRGNTGTVTAAPTTVASQASTTSGDQTLTISSVNEVTGDPDTYFLFYDSGASSNIIVSAWVNVTMSSASFVPRG